MNKKIRKRKKETIETQEIMKQLAQKFHCGLQQGNAVYCETIFRELVFKLGRANNYDYACTQWMMSGNVAYL